jgi:hypothetical protein
VNCPFCQSETKTVRYLLQNEDYPFGVATVGQSCSTLDCPGNMDKKKPEVEPE